MLNKGPIFIKLSYIDPRNGIMLLNHTIELSYYIGLRDSITMYNFTNINIMLWNRATV